MSKKWNIPTEERQGQEQETNEMLLAEDAMQTTAYLANGPGLLLRRGSIWQCAWDAGRGLGRHEHLPQRRSAPKAHYVTEAVEHENQCTFPQKGCRD